MAYIGNQPTVGNFVKLDAIVTSATATYNLLNGGVAYTPASVLNMIVSLNGVIQEPTTASNVGGFTVSGSTIVFTSALTSADVIDFILVLGDVLNIGTPSDGTVTTPKLASGITTTHALGSASVPSITFTGDTNTGIFSPTADTVAFTEGGAEAMRIDSSGNLNIGTTGYGSYFSGRKNISLGEGATINASASGSDPNLTLSSNAFFTSTPDYKYIVSDFASNYEQYNGTHVWQTAPSGTAGNTITFSERMKIDSSGNVLVGKTADSLSTAGIQLQQIGEAFFTRNGALLSINRLTTDGTLVVFYQDTVQEGSISVSGTTVTYSAFTGSHWSRFIDESKPDVLRGTVMESLDEMIDWYHVEFETSYTEKDSDGNDVVKTAIEKKPYALKANEQEGDVITYNFEGTDYQATIVKELDVKHMMSKISDTSEAKNVYGVFHAWDNDDLINNDFYVASVGSYVVRIKAGQTVSKGDLLQSNGDGTAKVQADDIIRASTFAKVLSNTVIQTYEDGSFIVPCSLMC